MKSNSFFVLYMAIVSDIGCEPVKSKNDFGTHR